MTSFSHSEFKDLLITHRFTLCQMVDFLYNMDIYDTNMVYIKIRIIMTHFWDITSSTFHNWANIRDKYMKIAPQIYLNLFETVANFFLKNAWSSSDNDVFILWRHHRMMTKHFSKKLATVSYKLRWSCGAIFIYLSRILAQLWKVEWFYPIL